MTEAASAIEDEGEGLVLDTSTHRYSFDGRPVAGVTEIICGLGIVDSRWFTEYARERGTAVHDAAHLLVQGRLDWTSVDPRIVGYVNACAKFLDEAMVPIGAPSVLAEHLLYSRAYGYAGKMDLSAPVFAGDLAVIDYKSGGLGEGVGLQLAAYEEPLREELGLRKPLRRMAVQLRADGTYKKTDYNSRNDFGHFAACALIYREYLMAKRRKEEE